MKTLESLIDRLGHHKVRDMIAAQFASEFRALPPSEEEVLPLLVADRELRDDLQDSLTIEARRSEPSRPLNDVLADLET